MREEYVDRTVYLAVVNAEEQYSVWPQDRPIPAGWKATGASGTREQVLAWIAEVWIDGRPLSVRNALAAGKTIEEAWGRR